MKGGQCSFKNTVETADASEILPDAGEGAPGCGELMASSNRRALFSLVSSAKVIIIIATALCQ